MNLEEMSLVKCIPEDIKKISNAVNYQIYKNKDRISELNEYTKENAKIVNNLIKENKELLESIKRMEIIYQDFIDKKSQNSKK